jgi:uncharacterized protein YndB with AHSA1/START domain
MTHGLLEQGEGGWRLRFTRRLPHPPATVWRALTEPEHLDAWFPTTIEGELVPGGALRFEFRDDAYDPFDGELVAIEPPRLLEFWWGTDLLRFELAPDDGGSVLTLYDTLDVRGKAARDAAGWHVLLDQLERHLAGRDQQLGDEWKAREQEYAELFGPEAATVGPPEPRRRG